MASGEVFTAADAIACGYDRQALSRLAAKGQIVRIGRGTYVDSTAFREATSEQRHRLATRSAVVRMSGRVAASHYSALCLVGLPVWQAPLDRVQVARIGAGCARRSARLQIHRAYPEAGSLPLVVIDGIASVLPELAVLGTAMVCGVESGVISADAALHAGMVTKTDLSGALQLLSRHPGVRSARIVVDLADGRSESPGESRARLVLMSLQLGALTPQADIRELGGRLVARVDFLYEAQRTVIEFDGLMKYSTAEGRQALIAEKHREDRLRDLGFQVVRLTWADLDRPMIIRRRVEAAFARTIAA